MPLRSFGYSALLLPGSVLALSAFVACGGKNEATAVAMGGAGSIIHGGSGPTASAGSGDLTSGAGGTSSGGSGGAAQAGGSGGSAGAGGASGGSAGSAGNSTDGYPTSCDDIGMAPTIPPACSTVLATKTATDGKLTDEAVLDTQAIQTAITACPAGMSVKLAVDGANNALLSGPISLKSGVTLWIDSGVTLFASRNPRDFDAKPNACSTGTGGASNCLPLIAANSTVGSGVMGEGTIDGRGGEPIIGQEPLTWWQLNDKDHLNGNLTAPRLIQTSGGKNFTIYQTHFQNSPKFHIVIGTPGYTVWGITVNTDPTSPNTDGVDPSTGNGLIAYNTISTGDDNVAIKGSTSTPINNIIVAHNHFFRGHGMSIGSETNSGVQNVKVCDLTLDGTNNGLRIKSDASSGGLVQTVSYNDVCMRGVKDPFVFDAYYSSATGTLIPNFQDISLHSVHVTGTGATNNTFRGYDATHITTISLDNVIVDDAGSATYKDQDTSFTFGPGPVNLDPATGTGITITKSITGSDAPKDCTNVWVPAP
ncbi:MAG TPA: glycosyl hydrolase family 28 protein [Polyangiaceae bacterium]|jgi:polygalacturonase|nr:glycosyl hydrolase family 28 protein [Polyangiaceae bacterium]